jgi:predicted NACHT family NTPase
VALNLAQAALDQSGALRRLGQWWKFGPLLPVRIVLRQFAASLSNGLDRGRAKHLWDFLEIELQRLGLPHETAAVLRQAALSSGALFLFDGLDECRDRNTRARVLDAVAEFARTAGSRCRFLLTSRPYAWQDFLSPEASAGQPRAEAAAVLAELPHSYRLANFDSDQIQTFIRRWYQTVQAAGWLGEADAKDKAANLQQAVRRPDLAVLARNPLLLTLMATLHSNRTRLPDDRADLDHEVVELLLQRNRPAKPLCPQQRWTAWIVSEG